MIRKRSPAVAYKSIEEGGTVAGSSSSGIGVGAVFVASLSIIAFVASVVALGIGSYAYSLAKSANDVTSVQPALSVWVNAGPAGSDANDGSMCTRPVKTMQRAIDILQQHSAETGIVELDGTVTHDLGVDPTLDFFPLIARYGTILIRGRRTNVHRGTVNTTTRSNPAGMDEFIQIVSTNQTNLTYTTHVVQNLNTTRFFAVESNDNSTINVVGGNYASQDFAIIWHNGDAFEMYQISSTLTWSGQWNNMASFSRVVIESVRFEPVANTSQLITPKYRDDAMIFRACHFTVANTATYDFDEPAEGGFASEFDPRPFFRGSLQLEGCFLNGVSTVLSVAPASTFTTEQVDTKIVLLSVYSNGVQVSFSGVGVVIGFYGINHPRIPLLASAGTFYGQGLKYRGSVLQSAATLLRIGIATSAKIRNVDINVTGAGVVGLFMDAQSFGEVSHARIICPGVFYAIRLGEVTQYRVYNITTVSPVAISLQRLGKLDLYGFVNMTGVPGVPLIVTEGTSVIVIGSVTSYVNHTGNAAPIVSITNSEVDIPSAPSLFWSTDVGYPLIAVSDMSSLRMTTAVINQNTANVNGTIKCGANAIGPMTTQTDYASPTTQLCVCKATP